LAGFRFNPPSLSVDIAVAIAGARLQSWLGVGRISKLGAPGTVVKLLRLHFRVRFP